MITLRPWLRCHHRSRLGLPCLRSWTYDYWCGRHNGRCWFHVARNRCPWTGRGEPS